MIHCRKAMLALIAIKVHGDNMGPIWGRQDQGGPMLSPWTLLSGCSSPIFPVASIKLVRLSFNTLRPRQNGRHFPDDIFKLIFLNENVWIFIKISLKFVPNGPIDNIPALVQIMAWHRPGDKPLSEPMMVRLPTHICVTRPQYSRE